MLSLTKQNELSRSLVVASYEMALLLSKKKKPFADGEEILKPALEIAARMLADKQVETKLKDIPTSVSTNIDVIEELLGLESLQGTTKGSDLFSALQKCVEKSNMKWVKLDSICTDCCPAITGKSAGCLALLQQFLERPLLKYHCIIHQ